MELDDADLAVRLDRTTAHDTVRGMMFNGVMHEVIARYGAEAGRLIQQKISPSGWRELLSYPAGDFLKMFYEVAELGVRQGAQREETLRWVGGACADSFLASTIGRTLLLLWIQAGVLTFLNKVGPAYRLVVGYGTRHFEQLGPNEGRLHFRGDMQPALFHEGVIQAGFRALKAEGTVTAEVISPLDFDLICRWR